MGFKVYTSEAEALALQAKIDLALGWPKVGEGVCQRVHVGEGRHVDHPLCCTVTHTKPIKHPKEDQWAIQLDDESRDAAGSDAIGEAELTEDWKVGPTLAAEEVLT